MPYVRVVEGAVLKTVELKGFAGSNPVYSVMFDKNIGYDDNIPVEVISSHFPISDV